MRHDCFFVKDLVIDSFIRSYHRDDGESLLNVFAAGGAVYFAKLLQGLNRFVHGVDENPSLPVPICFTTGSEIHGDHGHASGITGEEIVVFALSDTPQFRATNRK